MNKKIPLTLITAAASLSLVTTAQADCCDSAQPQVAAFQAVPGQNNVLLAVNSPAVNTEGPVQNRSTLRTLAWHGETLSSLELSNGNASSGPLAVDAFGGAVYEYQNNYFSAEPGTLRYRNPNGTIHTLPIAIPQGVRDVKLAWSGLVSQPALLVFDNGNGTSSYLINTQSGAVNAIPITGDPITGNTTNLSVYATEGALWASYTSGNRLLVYRRDSVTSVVNIFTVATATNIITGPLTTSLEAGGVRLAWATSQGLRVTSFRGDGSNRKATVTSAVVKHFALSPARILYSSKGTSNRLDLRLRKIDANGTLASVNKLTSTGSQSEVALDVADSSVHSERIVWREASGQRLKLAIATSHISKSTVVASGKTILEAQLLQQAGKTLTLWRENISRFDNEVSYICSQVQLRSHTAKLTPGPRHTVAKCTLASFN